MKKLTLIFASLFILFLTACNAEEEKADAYGNFEATEVLVSSEANGKLLKFEVEEGKSLKTNQLVGVVDTSQLYYQMKQLEASIGTISSKTVDAQPQIAVFLEKKENLLREKKRIEALLEDEAATQKQLDDINGEIDFVEKQIASTQDQIATQNRGVLSEANPVEVQIQRIKDQISKSYIYNPIEGTVLSKFAEPSEVTGFGKPLYKIANLQTMTLRVYVSGKQLSSLKMGQKVEVLVDDTKKEMRKYEGQISWIASEAEFTPKTIQTKEERVDMVYAVKIEVKNDGMLKIGMPAEVNF